ncbi:MAG: PepSY domain-containing protein [Acidobacteriota bacterium]
MPLAPSMPRPVRTCLWLAAALVLVAAPSFAAQDGGCPSGTTPWVYASGSTGVAWMNDTPGHGRPTAMPVAHSRCSQAWNGVGHAPALGMQVNVTVGAGSVWHYTCIACLVGDPPNVGHGVAQLPFGIGDGVVIGGQTGGGHVIGIHLEYADAKPVYYVNVARNQKVIQVLVDAETGHAEVVRNQPATNP